MGFKGGAGSLDRRITFQRLPDPDGTRNNFGELTGEPTDDLVGVPAAYDQVGTRQFPEAQKRQTETTGRFRVRYHRGFNVQQLPETHRVTESENPAAIEPIIHIYKITGAYTVGRLDEIHVEVAEVR
jgi:head-tail adaptor